MLDKVDESLVKELIRDADRNIEQLAKAIHLPKSTVHARKKRLEDSGVIKGYRAIPDYRKISKDLCVFVSIALKQNTDFTKVINSFQKMDCVYEIHTTTGEIDLLVKARFKDTKDLNDFLFQTEHGARRIEGIAKTNSMIVLDTFKEDAIHFGTPI